MPLGKKDENFNGKQMKITLGYKDKMNELEFKINKLEKTHCEWQLHGHWI